jgi:hypothetical protein
MLRFIDLPFHQLVVLSTWHCINMTFHKNVISSKWHFIKMAFIIMAFHQNGISSKWHFIKMAFHQNGISLDLTFKSNLPPTASPVKASLLSPIKNNVMCFDKMAG